MTTNLKQVFRALLASNLSFEAMLVFADCLEEYGEGLRLGGGVSALASQSGGQT